MYLCAEGQLRRAPIIVSAGSVSAEPGSIAKSVIVRATSVQSGSSSMATQVRVKYYDECFCDFYSVRDIKSSCLTL